MRTLGIALLSALLLTGCHSARQTAAAVMLTNTDSVNVVYIETVSIDTVIIEVPVPMESARQTVTDSTSHLETSVAESDAWLNPDGTLGHSLTNKPATIGTQALVPHTDTTTEKEIIRERQVPVPEPYTVEVERELTHMEQMKLATYWYLAGALMLAITYIFRRPLLRALRKLIFKG